MNNDDINVCKFEILDYLVGTYDDNGCPQCFICKYWHECRGKEILEEMDDLYRSLVK